VPPPASAAPCQRRSADGPGGAGTRPCRRPAVRRRIRKL